MPNINLAAQSFENNEERKRWSSKGMGIIIASFFSVLVVYGVLLFLQNKTDKNIENVRSEYDSKYSNFISSNAKDVIDFRDRLNLAKTSMEGSVDIRETLSKIEELIISDEVSISSYEYDDKTRTISLVCLGKDYSSIAKQILSFKKSDYFLSVAAGKTAQDKEKSAVSFNVDVKIK